MSNQSYVVYDESKNPDQAGLPGVPLADMSKAEYDALPLWLQASVCACAFYTVPATASKSAAKAMKAAAQADVADETETTDEVNPNE